MEKQLLYFNANGLAESIRYILHYTKQKFEDVRYDSTNWPIKEIKDSLPYGKMPLYKEGDRTLHQSLAIAKYVARDSDLIPKDPWQQAILDSTVYTIYDFWTTVISYFLEEDMEKKYEMKKKILEESMDFFFSRFEKHLKENGGYFIGKLSWADFILCGMVESCNMLLDMDVTKNYPTMKAVVEKIRNLPGVKEHIAARGPYNLPYKTTEYKGLKISYHVNKALSK